MNTSLVFPLPPQLTSLNLPFTCMNTLTVHLLILSLLASPRISFQGPRVSKEYPNLISVGEKPHIFSTNILKSYNLVTLLRPFVSPQFPIFPVYPIGFCSKKALHRVQGTIFHLSFPIHQTSSINSHICPTDYSLHYITIDTAISNILKLVQGCFMSNLDI